MSTIAIRCEGISKRYRLGERQRYRALRDTLAELMRAPFRRTRSLLGAQVAGVMRGPEFVWALLDVSMEIRRGEVLGIIGRNGAGKSTLLKILSRITRPSAGRAEIYGRTGALLEVGTGFHPELTGRENIFLNGAILGMARREIDGKFDEIVEFSECSRFIDTAVKHYSTGMYMRLAFAIAAHLETEILLVDEVLAVGDAPFQKKCLAKASEAATEGRTVLLVSHNLLAVNSLCSRAICLHEGRIVAEGPPQQVTTRYSRDWIAKSTEVVYADPSRAPGNERFRLRRACVRPRNGTPADEINVRTPLVVEFEYQKLLQRDSLELVVNLHNEHGIHLLHTWWPGDRPVPSGMVRSWFEVPGDLLNAGLHRIHLLGTLGAIVVVNLEDLLVFDVQDSGDLRGLCHEGWPGAVRPNLEWKTEQVAALTLGDGPAGSRGEHTAAPGRSE